jgi:hypothetical protein
MDSIATAAGYTYWPIGVKRCSCLGFRSDSSLRASSARYAFFAEFFPSCLRDSGQGFSYNFGLALGAVFPALAGYLGATMLLGHAIAVFALSAYPLMILAVVLMPETRGRDLYAFDRQRCPPSKHRFKPGPNLSCCAPCIDLT